MTQYTIYAAPFLYELSDSQLISSQMSEGNKLIRFVIPG